MKVRTLSLLAGLGAPLIVTGSAGATYLGVYATAKPNPYGILTVNVYAEFDNPGGDEMEVVAGTPAHPMNITVLGGTFYNHTFGSDQAPQAAFVAAFPELGYDSFFTIGRKVADPPGGSVNALNLINMPLLTGSSISTTNGAWGLVPPTAPQGHPFDPINCFPGNGSVLIGQFSTADGYGIRGSFLVSPVSDGVDIIAYAEFEYVIPAPGAWGLLGLVGLMGTGRHRRRRR